MRTIVVDAMPEVCTTIWAMSRQATNYGIGTIVLERMSATLLSDVSLSCVCACTRVRACVHPCAERMPGHNYIGHDYNALQEYLAITIGHDYNALQECLAITI